LLAQVHRASGDAAAAAQDLQRSDQVPEDSPFPSPYFAQEMARLLEDRNAFTHAEELAGQGRLPEAVTIVQQLLTRYPEWGLAWLHMGQLLIQAHNPTAGERALRKAATLIPDSPRVHFFLGVALTEQGRNQEAAASFRRATELLPGYAEAHFGLSRCLQAQGDRDGAVQSLRAAVRYLPSYVQARVTLGELLAQSGRPAEGLEQLRSAARLRPVDENINKLMQQLEAQCRVGPTP
jgi:tetratricopeptide (TPR) repeat protein